MIRLLYIVEIVCNSYSFYSISSLLAFFMVHLYSDSFFYCISFHPPLFKYNILLFSFSFLFPSLSFFPTLSFTSHFQPVTSLSYITLLILSLIFLLPLSLPLFFHFLLSLFTLFLFFLFLSLYLLLYYLSSLISSFMLYAALTDNSSHLS